MSDIEEKIQSILRQTDYTYEAAKEKLELFDNDHIRVIKDYLGITEKKALPKQPTSVNQEIYRQIRYKLDESMRDYNVRKEQGEK